MRSQRLGNARAEPVGLGQHRDQHPDVVHAVREAKFLKASIRGLPARISVTTIDSSSESAGMNDRELLAGLHDGLVEARAGLHADGQQIERVRQPVANGLLPQLRLRPM